MASLNRVDLIGRLGKEVELKYTPSGVEIASFSVATSERVKRGDNYEDKTEWHDITCFGKTAQFAADWLSKGSQVYIEGKLSTSSWEDNDGKKRYKTGIICNRFQNLTPKQQTDQPVDNRKYREQEPPF